MYNKFLAQILKNFQCSGRPLPITGELQCTIADLFKLFYRALNFAYYLGAAIATAFIIYGAFVIITSADRPAWYQFGRKTITNAVIGIVILVGARILVNTVYWLFGLNCAWYNIGGCSF